MSTPFSISLTIYLSATFYKLIEDLFLYAYLYCNVFYLSAGAGPSKTKTGLIPYY
jgi:hypothetical protein